MGEAQPQRHAVRPRAALPCRRNHTRAGVLVGEPTIRSRKSGGALAPAFNAFRGIAWMQGRCRSCPRQGGRLRRAAAARRWRSRAMRRQPTRSACSRRSMTSWRRWRRGSRPGRMIWSGGGSRAGRRLPKSRSEDNLQFTAAEAAAGDAAGTVPAEGDLVEGEPGQVERPMPRTEDWTNFLLDLLFSVLVVALHLIPKDGPAGQCLTLS